MTVGKVSWFLKVSEWVKVMSTVCNPWTIQSMEFSRPEYGSGEPFPSLGDLPNPGLKRRSLALQTDSLPAELQGSPRIQEWVAYPFSSRSSQPKDPTGVSCIAGRFFTKWAIRKALLRRRNWNKSAPCSISGYCCIQVGCLYLLLQLTCDHQ